jgi:hypothetical protein
VTLETIDRNNNNDNHLRTIYKLQSGVLFRNVRLGGGPLVTDGDVVLLHIKAFLSSNNQVLFDTRQDGKPIQYKVGSATLALNKPQFVTPGLDDALVSRGVLVSSQQQQQVWDDINNHGQNTTTSTTDTVFSVPPMRQGGIRLVVVPATLAYGDAGISRYQILTQLNNRFSQLVPRNEPIRYEVEVLRCRPVMNDTDSDNSGDDDGNTAVGAVQACCPEEVYPCQLPYPSQ